MKKSIAFGLIAFMLSIGLVCAMEKINWSGDYKEHGVPRPLVNSTSGSSPLPEFEFRVSHYDTATRPGENNVIIRLEIPDDSNYFGYYRIEIFGKVPTKIHTSGEYFSPTLYSGSYPILDVQGTLPYVGEDETIVRFKVLYPQKIDFQTHPWEDGRLYANIYRWEDDGNGGVVERKIIERVLRVPTGHKHRIRSLGLQKTIWYPEPWAFGTKLAAAYVVVRSTGVQVMAVMATGGSCDAVALKLVKMAVAKLGPTIIANYWNEKVLVAVKSQPEIQQERQRYDCLCYHYTREDKTFIRDPDQDPNTNIMIEVPNVREYEDTLWHKRVKLLFCISDEEKANQLIDLGYIRENTLAGGSFVTSEWLFDCWTYEAGKLPTSYWGSTERGKAEIARVNSGDHCSGGAFYPGAPNYDHDVYTQGY